MKLKLGRPGGVLVIAEIGMNHDGSLRKAKALIRAAAAAGADAVKFQTHIAEAETLMDAPAPPYFKAEPRFQFFKRTAFTRAQHAELKAEARSRGVRFISSPFSERAVNLLRAAGVDAFKIPSGEVTNGPLLAQAAATGIPVILSSGMSNLRELDEAVAVLRRGRSPFAVLQCTSMYPCPEEFVGLNLLDLLRRRYGCPVGLSDHTLGLHASWAAAALGADLIERHFTLSKSDYGPDARFSLEPGEFRTLVEGLRSVGRMLSHPVDKDALCRRLSPMKRIFEKSVVSSRAIAKGAVIGRLDLALKKPGIGIPPRDMRLVVGRTAVKNIPAEVLIRRGMFRRS